MTLNRFAAFIVEVSYAKFLDIALAVKAQLFLNCNLNWKPMAIPPGLTRYKATLHSLKAREDIFKNSRLNVMRSRHSIGGRWTLVKAPRRSTRTCGNGLMENLVIAPELENFMFEGRQIHRCWNATKNHIKAPKKNLEGRELLSQITRYHPPCAKFAPLEELTRAGSR
ncbi:unannotated protein [freshwater metagenome]|uniref:Unannotated protein n=1 Tax=freshwater metagenome TaxID=449393 RepID=A0A6J6TUN2_9ZZZZ